MTPLQAVVWVIAGLGAISFLMMLATPLVNLATKGVRYLAKRKRAKLTRESTAE